MGLSKLSIGRRLILVLFLFTGISIWYLLWIPPFEGPDEPEHLAYVSRLAEGRGFPPQGEAAWQTPIRQEASQPPLYYILASLPARLVGTVDPPAEYRPNPHFPSNAPGTIADNKNVAIHYPSDTSPLHGGWLALYLARGVSILSGIATLVAAFGLLREFAPSRPDLALAGTLLVALVPQVAFMSVLVSNDMIAAATGSLTLWGLASLLRRGPTSRRGLLTGIAFGLALLSKASSLSLALPLSIGFLWMGIGSNSNRNQSLNPTALWKVTRSALMLFVGAAVVAGWWYIRSWLLYGSPLGLDTHFQAPWAVGSPAERILPAHAWQEVFFSFWAAFGWGNVKYPGWIYYLLGGLVLVAFIGIIRRAWQRRQSDALLNPAGAIIITWAAGLFAVGLSLEIWMQQVTAPHGRLLFPALTAICGLLIAGWSAVHRRLLLLALSGLALLTILSPILLIRPAYLPPSGKSEVKITAEGQSVQPGWRFGEIAELEQVVLHSQSASAGEVLPITLCWRPLNQADKDYTVLVHLVGPENRVAAGRHTYPGLGSYPTSVWEVGRSFCDTVRVDIPADLSQTLLYKVEVGFLDINSGQRLKTYGPTDQLLSHTFAAAVRLQSRDSNQQIPEPAGEDPIRLVDAAFPDRYLAGEDNTITLYWWLADDLDQDFTVYIHLRDTRSGKNVAQADGPPLDGWYPTSVWRVGELVTDQHAISIPGNLNPGTYNLVTGWYDPVTGARLGQESFLGTVEIAP